ncbi:Na+/H+ antiporter NhaC [Elongatibacter sediminis]|uniref:Na+/H+ antiporter NhaC n=1 Tax=Elongatibacter sediminis TaxID=3119006 RepID=A0AAW9RK95_9GAMM
MKDKRRTAATRDASLVDALIPIAALIVMLALSVHLYGADSSYGANQIALLLAAMLAAGIAVKNGYRWGALQEAVVHGISTAMGAILILLAVGGLIGTWMLAGTVPTMIYYGVQILEPGWFFAAACLICSIASISIGSSWTVAGTLGVGLIGVAYALDVSPAITAGAVVSGAYFGDKMSPLSDTTNLAPAVAGTDLFTHIRHMAWTTVPSYTLALIVFLVLGWNIESSGEPASTLSSLEVLAGQFNLTGWSLLPLVAVFGLAMRKFPAFPTIMFGGVLGAVMAVILQPEQVRALAGDAELSSGMALLKGVWTAYANGYVSATGHEAVDSLLSRGGMSSMLVTIWLVISALTFGAVLEHAGMLERLIRSVLARARSTGALFATVISTCIGVNVIAADQYIAIVIPGRMFRAEFRRRGLRARNLSRAIEDSGTLTSPLVPWNTCGAFMAGALGVATLAYLPYALFNLINPLVSLLYGITGFSIERIEDDQEAETDGELRLPPEAVDETGT